MNPCILHYPFQGLQRLIVPFGKHKPPDWDGDPPTAMIEDAGYEAGLSAMAWSCPMYEF